MWCELCAEREATTVLRGDGKPVWAHVCVRCLFRGQDMTTRASLHGTARKARLPRLRHLYRWRGHLPRLVPWWQPVPPTPPRHGRTRWLVRLFARWPRALLAGLLAVRASLTPAACVRESRA